MIPETSGKNETFALSFLIRLFVSQRLAKIEERPVYRERKSISPRRRSRSKEPKIQTTRVNKPKQTYAEILAKSNRNPNTIRLIRVNDEDTRHCHEIMQLIQKWLTLVESSLDSKHLEFTKV